MLADTSEADKEYWALGILNLSLGLSFDSDAIALIVSEWQSLWASLLIWK